MQVTSFLKEFWFFVYKQARASLFAGSFLFLLVVSNYFRLSFISRADFLFLSAVLIQYLMWKFKLETTDEIKTIFLFHIIGLVLELYKTSHFVGSWNYPELGYLHIAGVPLYSGFMYASIGSYVAQSWKIMKLKLVNAPSYKLSLGLAILIYLNFFTNHFIPDFRLILGLLVFILYWKTKFEFQSIVGKVREMPAIVAFVLIASFVWIAENIGTFVKAWQYSYQVTTWSVVSLQKVSSWSLLVIISILLIAYLKHIKEEKINHVPSISK